MGTSKGEAEKKGATWITLDREQVRVRSSYPVELVMAGQSDQDRSTPVVEERAYYRIEENE